jgi:hypothetical protein
MGLAHNSLSLQVIEIIYATLRFSSLLVACL